ncbi:MAG: response regulator [Chitinophagales bacterium]|nr:response regulator [Chitinophagales bacterium]
MELLIIEDDIRVSELLKRAMEAEGCSVTLAHDGMTGFDLATTKAFDLVILDVILPKMDGITLCKELRKYKSNVNNV